MDAATWRSQPVWLYTTAVAVILILNWLRVVLFDPLRRIPGPFLARFTRLWQFQEIYKGDFHKTNIALHKKYGPIVRIAPRNYSIDNPQAAKTIYGHGNQFPKVFAFSAWTKRGDWYQAWGHPQITNLFNEQNQQQHAEDRRKVANAYSMTSLVSYEPYVNESTALLAQRLSEFAKAGLPMDLGYWLHCYAFDMIGFITFGQRFGFLDAGEDMNSLIKSGDAGATMSTLLGVLPEWFPLAFKFRGIWNEFKKAQGGGGLGFLTLYALKQIEIFKKKPKVAQETESFIVRFLRLQEERPESMTDRGVLLGVAANIAAGADTTSSTLSAIVYNLCRNPEMLKKLREELDQGVKSGRVSDPISFREAQDLPYLQAVIKEGLRFHPATGLPMSRIVPKGGQTIAGAWFPEGSTVGINSWVAHHNTDVYGPDADQFRPERWLEGNATKEMDAYFFSFGQGSRTCLGKNVSLLEISKGIPQLVRQFDFSVVSDDEWTCKNSWFVRPVDFRCTVAPRRC
ncbi:hypothetical protein N7492_009940 [Penicillium capsulatum]|uniref:Cytochrome P450 n=1 Tax=Penicillium capsulatum TaxID=69766 RepID=A0A9W9HN28_9EURO|nr:hypothetical protein N7492_009940 [Penicillium capsulatum]KAJ6112451.1 hypothetical protein N7512_007775 [Penicillium capsulatum]